MVRTASAARGQRRNGAGSALQRLLGAVTTELSTISMARPAAADRSFALTVATLGGFEEAQRAIHIFTNDLPARSTLKGEVLRAYAEQIDAMIASIAHAFPDHLLVVVSPSGPVSPRLPT